MDKPAARHVCDPAADEAIVREWNSKHALAHETPEVGQRRGANARQNNQSHYVVCHRGLLAITFN